MPLPSKESLLNASVVLWILEHKFVTETGKPFEFVNHRFMIDYLNDDHPHKATIKSSQVGWTTAELFDDIHLVSKRGLAVIHTMHNSDFLQSFVRPRVNPLIENNPAIAKMRTADSEGLKGFGKGFLYFKGANAISQAISTPADVLKIDEKDKSDATTVEAFQSRLDYSTYRWIREFSNPTAVGFGIDASWRRSDQRHWMIKCHHCNWEWYIDFEPDGRCHYVDREKSQFSCGKCGDEITTPDRVRGRWVARYPQRDDIHGYWVNQMMAPWFTAADIIKKYDNNSVEFFHSFVLGKAYTPSDLIVDRQTILRACVPSVIPRIQVAMGVDQKASEMEWVAGTPKGIFAYGRAKSWEEIEHLKRTWNAVLVADAMPYQTGPKQLAEKYPDAFMCYFKDTKGLDVLEWKGSVVYADRTRLLDIVAKEIGDASLLFRMRPQELEEYIADWANIYRTTVEEPDGRIKSQWLKIENKESDFSFATAYFRIALSRVLGSGSMDMIEPTDQPTNITDEVTDHGTLTTVTEAVRETMDMME